MNVDVSSDVNRLRMSEVQAMLSKAFWSPGITEAEIRKGIRNSALVVGAYLEDQRQVGFLRVVSDKVRFAYLMDVIVAEEFRRQGIGQKMVRFALAHPELKDVYQWLLISRDAQGVYEHCGFQKLETPDLWMSIIKPRPDRSHFEG
jgi:GNAT superfamily N-acetyltransferase